MPYSQQSHWNNQYCRKENLGVMYHLVLLTALLLAPCLVQGFVPIPLRRQAAASLFALNDEPSLDNSFLEDDGNNSQNNSTSSDMLHNNGGDAKVLKKKHKGGGGGGGGGGGYKGYKVTDNRDSLPFVVQLTTPDPYTKPELKKALARKNTELDRKKNASSKKTVQSRAQQKKYHNLKIGGVAASIFESSDDGELLPLLGEFQLDKSTTSGDIVLVGEQAYRVERARCQYKYAGGQRFEMVRKILEVKPVTRVATEAVLQRSLKQSSRDDEPPMLE